MYYLTTDKFIPGLDDVDPNIEGICVAPTARRFGVLEPSSIGGLILFPFRDLELVYDPVIKSLWCYFRNQKACTLTPRLMGEVAFLQSSLKRLLPCEDQKQVRYLIWASGNPDVFSFGGDLQTISDYISEKDRRGLRTFVMSGVRAFYGNYINLDLPIITVALASGDALGGGFEWCLSSDIIVAGNSARFGFPEMSFGLYPNIGAYSILQRRLGTAVAEELICERRILLGSELCDLGLGTPIPATANAEEGLRSILCDMSRSFQARKAIFDARRHVERLDINELTLIADQWVETALNLDPRNQKRLRHFARAQGNRPARHNPRPRTAA